MFWICRPHGGKRLQVTEIPPTWAPPYEAREAFTNRKVRGPAAILVSKSRTQDEHDEHPRGRYRFSVKHRRTDYARRVEREDDAEAIRRALDEERLAWEVYQARREETQAALQAAWALAKSVTEADAKRND